MLATLYFNCNFKIQSTFFLAFTLFLWVAKIEVANTYTVAALSTGRQKTRLANPFLNQFQSRIPAL
jgi:hypothetical protein